MAEDKKSYQGIGGSVYTKYQRKKYGIGRKDGGGKTMKRRGTYATVWSPTAPKKPGQNFGEVRCAIPRTKRERFSGPPNN